MSVVVIAEELMQSVLLEELRSNGAQVMSCGEWLDGEEKRDGDGRTRNVYILGWLGLRLSSAQLQRTAEKGEHMCKIILTMQWTAL